MEALAIYILPHMDDEQKIRCSAFDVKLVDDNLRDYIGLLQLMENLDSKSNSHIFFVAKTAHL